MDFPPLFVFTTVSGITFGAIYLWKATKLGRLSALVLLVAMVYGLAIEILDLRMTHEYFYAHLPLMVGKFPNWVPICIPLTWGAIVFTTMHTSNQLPLRWFEKPVLDGLLALFLDLAIDPVSASSLVVNKLMQPCSSGNFEAGAANGAGAWVWCVAPEQGAKYFGIPMANFFGWFCVVAAFSFSFRFVIYRFKLAERSWPSQIGFLLGASVLATILMALPQLAFDRFARSGLLPWMIMGTLILASIAYLARALRRSVLPSGPRVTGLMLLPAFTYAVAITTSWRRGQLGETPLLFWALLVVAVVGMSLFSAPSIHRRMHPGLGGGSGSD